MKNPLCTLCCLLLAPGVLFAQEGIRDDGLESPKRGGESLVHSPFATGSLLSGMPSGISVNHYTGTALVNVPLYTISSYGLDIPVSVTYSASGIKVNDYPSWVGNNWKLTGAGSVTRIIQGEPDETGYLDGHGAIAATEVSSEWNEAGIAAKINSGFDGQPDLYSFELPTGQSGMFVIDCEHAITLLPYQDVTVEWVNVHEDYNDRYFAITDAQGIKYTFGSSAANRETTTNNRYKRTKTFTTGWMLEQVEAGSRVIAAYAYRTGAACNRVFYDKLFRFEYKPSNNAHKHLNTTSSNETIAIVPKVLAAITWDLGRLDFASDDSSTGPRLKTIAVHGWNGEYVKTIHLDVGTFGSGSARTRIDRIYEKNGVTEKNICSFLYYDNGANFPAVSSNSFDHWGYYNGGTGSAWPQHAILSFPVAGTSRAPSLPHARLGSLQKIVYPTGGWTELAYELHTGQLRGQPAAPVQTTGGLRILTITHRLDANTVASAIQYAYDHPDRPGAGGQIAYDYMPFARVLSDGGIGALRTVIYSITGQPDFAMTDFTGSPVVYDFVKESFANLSYNAYEFAAFSTAADVVGEATYLRSGFVSVVSPKYKNDNSCSVPYTTRFFGRGRLTSRKQYSSTHQLVYAETYSYALDIPQKSSVYSYPLFALKAGYSPTVHKGRFQWISQPVVLTGKAVQSGLYNLASATTYTYLTSYNDLLPRTINERDARGNMIRTSVKYPQDYADAITQPAASEAYAVSWLSAAGARALPIETVSYRKNHDESSYNVTGAAINMYKWNATAGRCVLEQTKTLHVNTLGAAFTHSSVSGSTVIKDARYDMFNPQATVFNNKGNPVFTTVAGSGGYGTHIMYGNNGHVPIAYVSGVPDAASSFYTSFEEDTAGRVHLGGNAKSGDFALGMNTGCTVCPGSQGTYLLSYWRWDGNPAAQWEEVRTTFSGSSHTVNEASHYIDEVRVMPAGASMATQFVRPGVGVVSVMDEKGKGARFSYNALGMLESVQRHDRQTVEKYAYAYTASNTINHAQPVRTERYNGSAFLATEQYFDALGRPVQSIETGASAATGRDVVSFAVYDSMGRADATSYLPFVAGANNNGAAIPHPEAEQHAFYQALLPGDPDNNFAFAQKQYDESPLGLVLKAGAAGQAYSLASGTPIQYQYRLNVANEVKYLRVNNSGQLVYKGFYPAGIVRVRRAYTAAANGDDRDTYEYVNAAGQLVAKEERAAPADRRITYYVYDDFGRQRYVIPPIMDSTITVAGTAYSPTHDNIVKYGYYTEYDARGYPVRKRAPGAGVTSYVYDLLGRLALSQDALQAADNRWTYIKYDAQNRPVLSGSVVIGGSAETVFSALQSYMAGNMQNNSFEVRGTDLHGYTSRTYPTGVDTSQVLNATYYDDYAWTSGYAFSPADAIAGTARTPNSVTGMTTGTMTKVLEDGAPDRWLSTAIYYDNDDNPIQTVADLYPAGTEIVSNSHNFRGQAVRTRVRQSVGSAVHEYSKWLDYDGFGRLWRIRQEIAGDPQGEITLAQYAFDDLGNVTSKKIHGNKEETACAFDIARRMISAESPSFSFKTGFDKTLISGVAGRADGLIAQVTWSNGPTGDEKGYALSYDRLGQLTNAVYRERQGAAWTAPTDRFRETPSYDKNGNVRSMRRYGADAALMHDYACSYDHPANGNALTGVSGAPAGFLYDANGNMTLDGLSNAQIEYNALNLPQRIAGSDAGEIRYVYAANGQKLAAVAGSSATYYRNVMVYSKNGAAEEQIEYMLHPEGLVAKEGAAWVYKYLKTDHAGNTRALLAVRAGALQNEHQDTDYYPFGLAHQLNSLHLNRYLFGGKEYQDAAINGAQIGLYDFHARYYSPALGRWLNQDPAAQFANPYLYAANNPVNFTDPDGEWIIPAIIGGAAAYTLYFTDFGYSLQKALSPVAVNFDIRFGSNQIGIGMEASVGVPQIFPVSYRAHAGAAYFWKNTDLMGNDMSGWETRRGGEWSISAHAFGVPVRFTYAGTTFNSDWSGRQTTNLMTLGNAILNLKYENDMDLGFTFPGVPRGDGDRYRTAAAQINLGPFSVGTNMITGDAGPDRDNPLYHPKINGHETYIANNGYNPDSHRNGVLYFRFGAFRVGRNSEKIRHAFQNRFAHDWITRGETKWFKVLDVRPAWWWQFGYSGGGTLY